MTILPFHDPGVRGSPTGEPRDELRPRFTRARDNDLLPGVDALEEGGQVRPGLVEVEADCRHTVILGLAK
jgi:hypothetical protein